MVKELTAQVSHGRHGMQPKHACMSRLSCWSKKAYLRLFFSSAARRSWALITSTLPSTAPVLMTITSPLSAAKSLSASSACRKQVSFP